jgi:integrase
MAEVNQRAWRPRGQRAKKKAWGYTIQVDGKQVKSYRAEWTKDDAEKELAKVKLGIEQAPKATATGITLGEASDRYVKEKSRKRTVAEDRRLFDRVLLPALGKETPLADVTAAAISKFRSDRLGTTSPRRKKDDGSSAPIAAASVNRPLALLRHLLRIACHEWEVISTVPRIKLEKEPQGRLRWLEPEAARSLLAACRESRNPALVDLVEFALFTGLRQSEAVELTWDRVDFSRGVIRLELTKSGKRREVQLNAGADAVLVRRGPKPAGYVFAPGRWDAFRTAWENAVKRASLDDFRFHDLRHTFASWAVQRGASLSEVKELLGHSSLTMVLRYAHLAPEHLRRAVSRLDGVLQITPATDSPDFSAHGSAQGPSAVEVLPAK